MTSILRFRGLVVVVAALAATCALVLAEAQTSGAKQVLPAKAPVLVRQLPEITDIRPKDPDGASIIQAGKPFSILGRNFPAEPAAISVVISRAFTPVRSRTASSLQEVAKLRPSAASAARLDVLAPASLPAGRGRYFVHIVTKTGAKSNAVAVLFDAGHELTIFGCVSDKNNNGFPGIKVTATDPAKPTPYEAWTDSSGRYALRVPAPFTGQVLVHRPDNCFDCTLITRNLVNQATDIADVNFVCKNTTLVVGRTVTRYNEIIKGVLLDGLPGGPVTNDYGDYQATVPCGWSGTVTPVKTGWAFSPPSFTYSSLTQMPPRQDYIGAALSYRISGVVRTSGGAAIAGVKLNGIYPRSTGESNVTDADGGYAVSVYYGWSGTATPVKEGYAFSPASRSYTYVVAAQPNQDYVGTATETTPGAPAAAGRAARARGGHKAIASPKTLQPTR